jgi:hypothetical protein
MNSNNHRRVRRKSFDRRRPISAMRRPNTCATSSHRDGRRRRSGRASVLRRTVRIGRRVAATRNTDG